MPAVTRSRNASVTQELSSLRRTGMNQEQIKTLIDALAASDLAELEYSENGSTLRLVKQSALDNPPQTTRARLRGEFIKRAKERKRDYTVDWVHLKLNDQAQRTVLCKDPFRSVDDRVDQLIAHM